MLRVSCKADGLSITSDGLTGGKDSHDKCERKYNERVFHVDTIG